MAMMTAATRISAPTTPAETYSALLMPVRSSSSAGLVAHRSAAIATTAAEDQAVQVAGLLLTVAGIGLTLYAQIAMVHLLADRRRSCRADQARHHGTVRAGWQPIFAAMLPTAIGLALVVPGPLAIAGAVTLFVALELQVRVVEEPYLLAAHEREYRTYAERVGRFVPKVGRLHRS